MRIKKIYQGELPENKIVNEKIDSQTDTYSCDYINNLSFEGGNGVDELPIDSIIEYEGETVPDGWELVEGTESGERNYIQCELTDRLNIPDTNYVLVPFNNNLIMGGAFTYDESTNEVVIDSKSNIDKVKIHFHAIMSADSENPVSAFEVLVYRNSDIVLIANETMETGSSRTAVSVDRVVECAPGDRFRVEIKSYDNLFLLLNTYGRTVFSLEDMTNVAVNNVTVEGTIESKEVSFAQMRTNDNQEFATDVKSFVNVWGTDNIEIGKFRCEPDNNRIVIPAGSAEYIEIYGSIAGAGYMSGDIQLRDPDGNLIDEISNILQFGGNKYFSSYIGSKVVKIPDTSKDYYLTFSVSGYREVFTLNLGFANNATTIGVREITDTETVIGTGTIEAKEKNYIQCGLSQNIEGVDYLGKVIDFDQIVSNGDLFYMSSNSTIKVNENATSGRAKIHIHAGAETYDDKPIGNVYFMIWKNDVSIGAININLHAAHARNQSSIEVITDYVAGDAFHLSCGTSENKATVMGTYNRTMMSIEEITDTIIVEGNTQNELIIEEKQLSAITAVYKPTSGSSNWTVPETAVATKYPINTVQSQIGDGLTLDTENNNIVVGKGISAVMVFVKSTYLSDVTGTDHSWATYINHNDASMAQSTFSPTANKFMNINNSVMLNVQEGDTINLSFYGEQGDQVGRNKNTNITVFEIANTTVVEDAPESQSAMTLTLPSNVNYTSEARYAQDILPLVLNNSIGNKFTYENNGIKIGPGVSKVLISGQLGINAQTTGSLYGVVIVPYRNGSYTTQYRSLWTAENDKYNTRIISPRLIDVQEGDIIKLEFYIDAVGPSITIRNDATYLTVQEASSEVVNVTRNITNNVTHNITTNGMALIYSDTEQVIGTWFDKPLYQKTIKFGNMPGANETKTVAHNIANVEDIWIDNSGSYFLDTSNNYYDSSDYDWHLSANKTNVIATSTYDRTTSIVVVTVRYTKTTD